MTERTEYRVVGRSNAGPMAGLTYEGNPEQNLKTVKRSAWEARKRGNSEVRIEKRTVTESPWVDCSEEGKAC